MALSAGEIRTLNEIARRTAEEDPDYVRRLMSYGGRRSGESRRRGALRGRFRAPSRLPSLRTLLPVALVGVMLVAGFMVASLVAADSADGSHVRPDGPHARLQP